MTGQDLTRGVLMVAEAALRDAAIGMMEDEHGVRVED